MTSRFPKGSQRATEKKNTVSVKSAKFLNLRYLKKKGTISKGRSLVPMASAIKKPPKTGFLLRQYKKASKVKASIRLSP